MRLEQVLQHLAPYLGDGVLVSVGIVLAWLWRTYFQRADQQWAHSDERIADLKEDRNHWREVARAKGDNVRALEEVAEELREQNSQLKIQVAELKIAKERESRKNEILEERIETLSSDVETMKRRLAELGESEPFFEGLG